MLTKKFLKQNDIFTNKFYSAVSSVCLQHTDFPCRTAFSPTAPHRGVRLPARSQAEPAPNHLEFLIRLAWNFLIFILSWGFQENSLGLQRGVFRIQRIPDLGGHLLLAKCAWWAAT